MGLHNILLKRTAGSRPPLTGQATALLIRVIKVLKAKIKNTAVLCVGRWVWRRKKGRGVQVIVSKSGLLVGYEFRKFIILFYYSQV